MTNAVRQQASSMDKTPEECLHRVLTTLNWSRSTGRGVDGDVKSTVDPKTKAKTYRLKKQPREGKWPIGVSLFAPIAKYSKQKHDELGAQTFLCGVTQY